MMDITERFLNYTKFDTQSAEDSQSVPSTAKQLVFAEYLKKELEQEGLEDVELDEKGYIYATLPANLKGQRKEPPTIGFISHYDTSPDCSGADIKPQIIRNYDGGDILLSEGIVSSPTKFPELSQHVGEDLIVTDGTTLLGADDKAGIAEIVQAMVWLQQHKEIPHGKIRVAFNPDEEIGMGAHHFDVEKFGCEWAYTMDGGEVGELEFENFNAASAKITIKAKKGDVSKVLNATIRGHVYGISIPKLQSSTEDAVHNGKVLLVKGKTFDLETEILKTEQNRMLYEALRSIPEDYRQALHLTYFENMSNDEVAVVLDKNKKQVYNLITRGKQALKEALLKLGYEAGM